ncbi:MAG: hypothetical protein AAFU79_35935, partial [Myxococcota bacterium]
ARSADLLRRFARLMPEMRRLTHPERAVLARVKQWVRYLSESHAEMRLCFDTLKRRQDLESAQRDLDTFFPPEASEAPVNTSRVRVHSESREPIADAPSTV